MNADELQVFQDWNLLIDKISKHIDIPYIKVLKDLPVKYVEDLTQDTTDTIIETVVDIANLSIYLQVSEDYFLLKGEYAIMALLHELCHAILIIQYVMEANIPGLQKYYQNNGGHTTEWNNLAMQIKSLFPSIPDITVCLDLSDENIYEATV